ncbi:MAG TPA: mechanosensitive ion channel family protein [Bryobacteraceae bacterium]|nr:mechanosensitive ion channel family protein [Bryobacteraceae bacterium]
MSPDLFWLILAEFAFAFLLFWRSRTAPLRAPLSLSALGLVFLVLAGPFGRWPYEAALAAGLLALLHLILGYGLRRFTHNRIPKILIELLTAAGYVAVLINMLSRGGVNLSGLVTTSAVATALIGLSMQESLSNVIAGMSLQMEQSIGRGDWLRTSEGAGVVQAVRLRYTLLETADNDLIMVPNSVIAKNATTIIGQKRRKLIPFLVPYAEQSPHAIMTATDEALRAAPIRDVAPDPAPRTIVMEFRQDVIQFGVYAWMTRPGHELAAISDVLTRIYFALSRIGVQMGHAPQLLELRRESKRPAEEVLIEQLKVIDHVGLFRSLTDDEKGLLAQRLQKFSFAPGELILKQGDAGDSMFFVDCGSVRILVANGTGLSEELAVLPAGSFFGEMSLLTGEPRSATVMAAEQTDCWRLEKDGVQAVLNVRPEVAGDIANVLAQRRAELEVARQKLDLESAARLRTEHHLGLLSRIQQFFNTTRALAHDA